jgi:Transglycosylase-like domain
VATHGHVRAATKRELRRSLKVLRREVGGASASVSPQLEAIAQCESHGDPTAIGGGGLYRGKYQFTYGTWQAVGGHGDPAAAPEAEQDRRAAILLARSGTSQWPVCGA